MKIETNSYENFQFAKVEKDTPVTSLILSADCFIENTPKSVAIQMVYTDLLLSGAGKYNRDGFLYAVNELGANISVSENEGRINVSVKTLGTNLPKVLKLLETMLLSSTFSEEEKKRIIETTYNALVLYKDDSRSLAHDALRRSLYSEKDRHFEFTPDEIMEALKNVSISEVVELHNQFMNSHWIVTVGGGSKSIKDGFKMIESLKKPKLAIAPVFTKTSSETLKGKKLVTQSILSKQNIDISIGASLPMVIDDVDLPAFNFGLAVLGKWGGFAGRLMSIVREKEGLTYGIYAKTEGVSKTETAYWRIMTFFAPKDTIKGVGSTLREIKRIHENGITKSEWERFRNILKTGETLTYDSLSSTVGFVHGAMLMGVSFTEYKQYREKLYSCSMSEVNKALKKYLDPNNLVISCAGPVEGVIPDLKKLLKN